MSIGSLCEEGLLCSLSYRRGGRETCSVGSPCEEMFSLLVRFSVAVGLQLLVVFQDLPRFHWGYHSSFNQTHAYCFQPLIVFSLVFSGLFWTKTSSMLHFTPSLSLEDLTRILRKFLGTRTDSKGQHVETETAPWSDACRQWS